jgi:hypothetical protein
MKNSTTINSSPKLSSSLFICWIVIVLIHMSFHAIAQRKTNERELAKGTLYSKNLGLPGQEFFESDHTLNYPP